METPTGNVAPARPITVQDLMRHTSGFVHGGSTRSPRCRRYLSKKTVLMAKSPSNRIHTRMLYKDLVYGAMVE